MPNIETPESSIGRGWVIVPEDAAEAIRKGELPKGEEIMDAQQRERGGAQSGEGGALAAPEGARLDSTSLRFRPGSAVVTPDVKSVVPPVGSLCWNGAIAWNSLSLRVRDGHPGSWHRGWFGGSWREISWRAGRREQASGFGGWLGAATRRINAEYGRGGRFDPQRCQFRANSLFSWPSIPCRTTSDARNG